MTESAAPDTDPRARVDDELDRLLAAGAIGPLDREFARLLARFPTIDADTTPVWRPSLTLRGLEALQVSLR